jgi:hypothetical protein
MDFNEARQQRREILSYIKRQQAEDSNCVSRIKRVAVDAKRELLWALANWLEGIDTATPISSRTREAFAKATDKVSIDVWVELKNKRVALGARLEEAKTQAERAEDAYSRTAPFGLLSSVFADDATKSAIQRLKSTRDHALSLRDAAERDFGANERALSTACESFLRDTQIPDHLTAICEEPELKGFVVPILEGAEQRAMELWQAHARKHAKHSSDLELAARGLRLFYERSSSSPAPPCWQERDAS